MYERSIAQRSGPGRVTMLNGKCDSGLASNLSIGRLVMQYKWGVADSSRLDAIINVPRPSERALIIDGVASVFPLDGNAYDRGDDFFQMKPDRYAKPLNLGRQVFNCSLRVDVYQVDLMLSNVRKLCCDRNKSTLITSYRKPWNIDRENEIISHHKCFRTLAFSIDEIFIKQKTTLFIW